MSGAPHHESIPAELITRFLPTVQEADGPAALLEISRDPQAWSAPMIAEALLRQLSRIDDHPHARTPEADELRVALHVAAAQLRHADGAVPQFNGKEARQAEVAAEPTRMIEAPGAVEAGRQLQPAPVAALTRPEPLHSDFHIAARHVLASCGGWNAESKRRLSFLARSMGVNAAGMQRSLVQITQDHQRTIPSQSPGQRGVPGAESVAVRDPDGEVHAPHILSRANLAGRPLDAEPTNHRARRWMNLSTGLLFATSGVFAAMLLAIVIGRAVSAPPEIVTQVVGTQAPSGQASPVPTGSQGRPSSSSPPPAAPVFETGTDHESLVRLLNSLDRDAFRAAPEESAEHFRKAVEAMSREWADSSPQVIRSASVAIRDAVLAATDHSARLGVDLLEVLTEQMGAFDGAQRTMDPVEISSSSFSFATAGLLLDTPLSPPTERALRSRLNSIASTVNRTVANQSFSDLLETALRVHASSLIPRASDRDRDQFVQAWRHWATLCNALPTASEGSATRLKLDAIERIAGDGENASMHEVTQAVLAALTRHIDWSDPESDQASRRLLAWLDNVEAIDSEVLSIVTGELVDAALLPSLTVRMRLSSTASTADRRSLRDQYAVRFGLPQIGDGRVFVSEWAGFVEELLAQDLPTDHAGALNIALRASWLNEAAMAWMVSDEQAARSTLDRARQSLHHLTSGQPQPVSFGRRQTARADGEWAARYLRARRNTDERMKLLHELGNTGGPGGQADADVLAEAASYSTPMEVRRLAQRMVLDHANQPEIVLGLLEVLPRAARQDGVAHMIEEVTGHRLPSTTSQSWRLEARRALVSRAMEMLSSDSASILDVARSALALSLSARLDYHRLLLGSRSGSAGMDPFASPSAASDPEDPMTSLVPMCDLLLTHASRHPERVRLFAGLDELRARRSWRTRLTSNATGQYAAELASCLDLSAYVLGCERPSLAAEMERIVREASAQRRSAVSVYQQIAINELGMLRLNLHRMGAVGDTP